MNLFTKTKNIVTIEAVVTRKDGTVEDLGVISRTNVSKLRILLAKLFGR